MCGRQPDESVVSAWIKGCLVANTRVLSSFAKLLSVNGLDVFVTRNVVDGRAEWPLLCPKTARFMWHYGSL